jgi:hypothetical protein
MGYGANGGRCVGDFLQRLHGFLQRKMIYGVEEMSEAAVISGAAGR